MADTSTTTAEGHEHEEDRRDFLLTSTIVVGAAGVALAAWPFIDFMNPSADVLALASLEFDLSSMEPGQAVTVTWRNKPVFIRRRTAAARAFPAGRVRPGSGRRHSRFRGCRVRPAAPARR